MSVRDKINNGEYENKLIYPKKPVKPILKANATPAEIRAYADEVEEYPGKEELWLVERNQFYAESSRLEQKFRDDLEAEEGTTGHPKANLLFSKAYERGHSGGLSEVLNAYEDMVELIR